MHARGCMHLPSVYKVFGDMSRIGSSMLLHQSKGQISMFE